MTGVIFASNPTKRGLFFMKNFIKRLSKQQIPPIKNKDDDGGGKQQQREEEEEEGEEEEEDERDKMSLSNKSVTATAESFKNAHK